MRDLSNRIEPAGQFSLFVCKATEWQWGHSRILIVGDDTVGEIEVVNIPSTAISKRAADTAIFLLPSEDETKSAYAPSVFCYNYQGNDLFNNRYNDQDWKKQQIEYVVALHDKLLTY
jgi:hypothetical protein